MARIKQYKEDNSIQDKDLLLGTDDVLGTSNFTIADLKEYINSGIDITTSVPPHFVPVVNNTGTDAAVSSIRELKFPQTTTITYKPTGDPTSIYEEYNRAMIYIVADGGWKLQIEDWTSRFDIMSLIGKTVTGTFTSGSNQITVTFVVGELVKQTDSSGKTRDFTIDYTDTEAPEVTDRVIYQFNITGDLDNFTFENQKNTYVEFKVEAIAANNNTTLDLSETHFYGDAVMTHVDIDQLHPDLIVFDQVSDPRVDQEGIRFGSLTGSKYSTLLLNSDNNLELFSAGDATFQVDSVTTFVKNVNINADLDVAGSIEIGANLTVEGTTDLQGDTSIDGALDVDGTIKQYGVDNFTSIREILNPGNQQDKQEVRIHKNAIDLYDFNGNQRSLSFVRGNGYTDRAISNTDNQPRVNGGVLNNIQIGDTYYAIPTSQNTVAQIIPGLREDLSPRDADSNGTYTTGTYFYGVDEGNTATWSSNVSNQPGAETINDNEVSHTVEDDTIKGQLNAAFSAIPLGQRLFFIESTDSLPSDIEEGDTVSVTTYEVVGYNHSSGVLTFSKLGSGEIVISSATLKMTNLAVNNTPDEFLVTDDDGVVAKKQILEIQVPFRNTTQYTDTVKDSSGVLQAISFKSNDDNDNIEGTAGTVSVEATGRIHFDPNTKSDDFNANVFKAYILDNVDETKTVTLPSYTDLTNGGHIVRIINLSDIGTNGEQVTSELWDVKPATGQRIMRLPADEAVTLNEATSTDFIYSGNTSIGWIIMQ